MKGKHTLQSISMLSDDELLRRLTELLRSSRRLEAELIAHIGEVDARRLYAKKACPSMFSYCLEVLHLSEHEAYLRISVARASRTHPVLVEMLADGRLHLSGIAKLAPYLTEANRESVLGRAAGKSKRQIEELFAELSRFFPAGCSRPDAQATGAAEKSESEEKSTRSGPSSSTPSRRGDATDSCSGAACRG